MTSEPGLEESKVDLTLGSASHGRVAASRPRAARRRTGPTRGVLWPAWEKRFAWSVIALDVAAILAVTAVGTYLGFGASGLHVAAVDLPIPLLAALLTLCSLFLTRAWEPTVLGQGSEEFSRVVRAVTLSAVGLGLTGLALTGLGVRPWVFGCIPASGLLVVLTRWALRKRLHRSRAAGCCMHPVLAIGTVEAVAALIERTRRDQHNGWVVTAACTPTGTGPDSAADILGVPVVGDLDAATAVARAARHRVVSVGSAPGWTSRRLHQLAWDLEEVGADLVVDPGLMEVAGPRLHVTPVDGQPLLRLTEPTFNGLSRLVKHAIDYVGAVLLLLLLSPVMLAIAVAVKCDGGPVFYRQLRVGHSGKTFRMLKFRSMVIDADGLRRGLLAVNEAAGPLFKLRHDPRITRVGAWIRRYSVDELPQLLNVLSGSMSLVGPRPPLPEEVATYSRDARRKFLVKPGLTGLWQVSGRSDLSWEETVRLDLRYVENWTLAQDALILWKTFGAVVKSTGAY